MIRRILLTCMFIQAVFAAGVKYTYDTAGRLTGIDYGPAGNVMYTYDNAGNRLSRVVQAGSNAPTITSVQVAWGGNAISANSWIEIKGTNLVPANTPASGVVWSSAPEFAQGRMPTKIGDISVTVNGKAAYIYFYCSAATNPGCASDQINVLAPAAPISGTVPVIVTSSAGSTEPFMVNAVAASPSFLFFNPAGYVIAQHGDYSLAGPTSLYPGATTPAHPGETLLLYTVGFGAPTTALNEGSSSQSGTMPSAPSCYVGSTAAAAVINLISPGLYQINLTVPGDAKPGDDELVCTYLEASTQPGALLSVAP